MFDHLVDVFKYVLSCYLTQIRHCFNYTQTELHPSVLRTCQVSTSKYINPNMVNLVSSRNSYDLLALWLKNKRNIKKNERWATLMCNMIIFPYNSSYFKAEAEDINKWGTQLHPSESTSCRKQNWQIVEDDRIKKEKKKKKVGAIKLSLSFSSLQWIAAVAVDKNWAISFFHSVSFLGRLSAVGCLGGGMIPTGQRAGEHSQGGRRKKEIMEAKTMKKEEIWRYEIWQRE